MPEAPSAVEDEKTNELESTKKASKSSKHVTFAESDKSDAPSDKGEASSFVEHNESAAVEQPADDKEVKDSKILTDKQSDEKMDEEVTEQEKAAELADANPTAANDTSNAPDAAAVPDAQVIPDDEEKKENVLEDVPPPVQIIYTSRTHSQLNQVLRELRKTAYVPSTAYLSSRDHMCINEDMKREAAGSSLKLRLGCKRLGQKCPYNKTVKVNRIQIQTQHYGSDAFDIEELGHISRKLKICPFHHGQAGHRYADLILMPYNYLLSSRIRKNTMLGLRNKVIIVDEAHNIGGAAEESIELELRLNDLREMVTLELMPLLRLADKNIYTKELQHLQYCLPEAKLGEANNTLDALTKQVKLGAYKVRAVLRQVISFKYSLDNISFYLPRCEYYRLSPEQRDLRRQCHEKPGTELGRIFVNMIREGHFKLFGVNPFEPALDETDKEIKLDWMNQDEPEVPKSEQTKAEGGIKSEPGSDLDGISAKQKMEMADMMKQDEQILAQREGEQPLPRTPSQELQYAQEVALMQKKDFAPRHLDLCKSVLHELSALFKDKTSL